MANTLSAIRTEVLNKLENSDFDSTTVNSFINQTHRQILNKHRFPFMEDTFSGTLTSGQYIYDLPTGAQELITFRITAPDANAIDLTDRFMPFREYDDKHPDPTQDNSGQPESWTMISNKFYIYPTPDQVYTLDTRFIKTPTALTSDSDVSDVPEEFQELLVLGAAARALERDDYPDEAAVYRAQFDEMLIDMVSRYSTRQIGGPTKMRSPRSGGRWNNSGWRL